MKVSVWWTPLLTLSAEHLSVVRQEGLLDHLEARALKYHRAAESSACVEMRRRLLRRAALLRETRVALDQAGDTS